MGEVMTATGVTPEMVRVDFLIATLRFSIATNSVAKSDDAHKPFCVILADTKVSMVRV
jgi:hypothetical protein